PRRVPADLRGGHRAVPGGRAGNPRRHHAVHLRGRPAGGRDVSDAVVMREIVKSFGSVEALKGVDLTVRTGEIHALLGETGAGKTTLMKVLYGLYEPDGGEIEIEGRETELRTPQEAIGAGIAMVHQHFMLVPTLTVAENMVVGERGGPLLRRRE